MGRILNIYSSCTTFYKANPNFTAITCLRGTIAQPHATPSPSGWAICRPPPEQQRAGALALRFSMGIHNRRQQVLNTLRRGVASGFPLNRPGQSDPQLRALLPVPSSENHLHAWCCLSFRGRRGRGTGHLAYNLVPHRTLDHLHRWDHLTPMAQFIFPQEAIICSLPKSESL